MRVDNRLADEGLTVITASSPGFMDEVTKFSRSRNSGKVVRVLPSALIVTNDTGKYLWGFTVVYTYPEVIAGTDALSGSVTSPSAVAYDRNLMMSPGSKCLITPVSDVYASIMPDGKRRIFPIWEEGADRMLKMFVDFYSTKKVDIAIDFMVYEDGSLVGPDSMGRLETLNTRIRADRDLHAELSNLHGQDRSAPALNSSK